MTSPINPPPEKRPQQDYAMRVMAVGGEIGCITLGIVLVAVFGGLWLDRMLGTKPIFTFILVLLSAPIALYFTFRVALRLMNRMNQDLPPARGGNITTAKEKEDEDR
jgi:hypothetical protein